MNFLCLNKFAKMFLHLFITAQHSFIKKSIESNKEEVQCIDLGWLERREICPIQDD